MTVKHGLNRLLGGRGDTLRAEDPETPEEDKAADSEDNPETPEEDKAEDPENPDDPEEDAPEEEAEGEDDTKKEASARKAGHRAGRKAELARVRGILDSKEARGREGLARSLALDTGMDADSARTVLGKAAKESGGLAAVMAGVPNPDVGPDGGGASAGDSTVESVAGRIVGKRRNSNH